MKQLLIAFQFLSIIPVKINSKASEKEVTQSAYFFILIGLVQGIILLIVTNLSDRVFHPDLSIFITLLSYILLNGGFHIDGLADTFDAIAVKSTGSREFDIKKRLSVMKDSLTGAIGVTAIISIIVLKYLSLKNISHFLPFTYYSSILLMPVLSKWAMISVMLHGRPAKKEGLGFLFLGKINYKGFLFSAISLVGIYSIIYALFYQYMPDKQYIFYAAATIITYFLAICWSSLCNKKFGGSTGDTLGAISEISEAIFLLMVITWSRLYI